MSERKFMPTDYASAVFVVERDAMLLSGDVDIMLAFNAEWAPKVPAIPRAIAEVALHQARTAAMGLPLEERRRSKMWLAARGLSSLDNGDLS